MSESSPPPAANEIESRPTAGPIRRPSLFGRALSAFQFLIALGLTGAMLAWLLFFPPKAHEQGDRAQRPAADVTVIGPELEINPKSELYSKLTIITTRKRRVRDPILNTSGTVIASLRPGVDKGPDYWQFNAPELLTAHTDYEKARADITFATTQLKAIGELADARVKAQEKVVDRLTKLVKIGTDPQKDLDTEKANLLQFRIQGRKDVYEAETAVRIARRNENAMARQLQQAGLEPDLLASITSDYDLVMAEVPEARLSRVKVGQQCEARFFGIPNQIFTGKVARLSPIVTRERRTLRVLFAVDDLKDQLRPGMFAEIGLGTDPRDVLRVPAEALVHVGRGDYVLVQQRGDRWEVREVEAGEQHGEEVDVYSGVVPGEKVLAQGSLLLKPYIAQAMRKGVSRQQAARNGGQP